jgi:hypothetical protein
MSDYARERKLKKKREYYRKWRAEHPEAVKAANVRYWAKKAEEMQLANGIPGNVEIRSERA